MIYTDFYRQLFRQNIEEVFMFYSHMCLKLIKEKLINCDVRFLGSYSYR